MKNNQGLNRVLLFVFAGTSSLFGTCQKAMPGQLKGLVLLQKDSAGKNRISPLYHYCSDNYTEQCAVINKALEFINPSLYNTLMETPPTVVELTIATGQLISDSVKNDPDVMRNTLTAACEDEKRIQEIVNQ